MLLLKHWEVYYSQKREPTVKPYLFDLDSEDSDEENDEKKEESKKDEEKTDEIIRIYYCYEWAFTCQ